MWMRTWKMENSRQTLDDDDEDDNDLWCDDDDNDNDTSQSPRGSPQIDNGIL